MAFPFLRILGRNFIAISERVALLTPTTVAIQNKAAWTGSVSQSE
jgi:hypothetical protein